MYAVMAKLKSFRWKATVILGCPGEPRISHQILRRDTRDRSQIRRHADETRGYSGKYIEGKEPRDEEVSRNQKKEICL